MCRPVAMSEMCRNIKTCLVTVDENEDDGDNGWFGIKRVALVHTVLVRG